MENAVICQQKTGVDLNAWLMLTAKINNGHQKYVRKHLVCNDGTTLSVQASHGHYCTPRECYIDSNTGEITYFEYSSVEVWCVSCDTPEAWKEYGDQEENPYAYIPVKMVEEFIYNHGGIKC